jgi:hypothetical protein
MEETVMVALPIALVRALSDDYEQDGVADYARIQAKDNAERVGHACFEAIERYHREQKNAQREEPAPSSFSAGKSRWTQSELEEWHSAQHRGLPPGVRECPGCGCLVAVGRGRCGRCAPERGTPAFVP